MSELEFVYMTKQGVLWIAEPGKAYTESPEDGTPVLVEVESSDPDAVFNLLELYGMTLLGEL